MKLRDAIKIYKQYEFRRASADIDRVISQYFFKKIGLNIIEIRLEKDSQEWVCLFKNTRLYTKSSAISLIKSLVKEEEEEFEIKEKINLYLPKDPKYQATIAKVNGVRIYRLWYNGVKLYSTDSLKQFINELKLKV